MRSGCAAAGPRMATRTISVTMHRIGSSKNERRKREFCPQRHGRAGASAPGGAVDRALAGRLRKSRQTR